MREKKPENAALSDVAGHERIKEGKMEQEGKTAWKGKKGSSMDHEIV